MVQIREEEDLLRGVGTGANPTVEGIYTVTGTQTQTDINVGTQSDALATLAAAIGKVENVDGTADGIAMNPLDYWAMVSSRIPTTSNMDVPNPWAGPPGTVWGLPVVRTRAILQTDAIVADWRGGGQVFDRQGITVRTSDSHDDYFVSNKVAILAEKRIAFAIYRPDFFVETEVGTPGT
jgi:HK97 family phage major capsid protein